MSKKLFSIVLTMLMIVSMIPSMIFAEEYYTGEVLGGTLKISGNVEVGGTLSADYSGVTPAGITDDDVTFEWAILYDNAVYTDDTTGEPVQPTVVGTSRTYDITDADLNQQIILTITGAESRGYSGTLTVTSEYVQERGTFSSMGEDTGTTDEFYTEDTGYENYDDSGYYEDSTAYDSSQYNTDTYYDDSAYNGDTYSTDTYYDDSTSYNTDSNTYDTSTYEYESGYEDVPIDEYEDTEIPIDNATEQTFVYDENGSLVEDSSNDDEIAIDEIAELSIQNSSLDFGQITAGYTEAPEYQTVTLTNDGSTDITIAADDFLSSFVMKEPESYTIAAGQSLDIQIQPAMGLSEGTYMEWISFYPEGESSSSASAVTASLTVSVYGEAVENDASTDSYVSEDEIPIDEYDEEVVEESVEETVEEPAEESVEESADAEVTEASDDIAIEDAEAESAGNSESEVTEEVTEEFDISTSFASIEYVALDAGYTEAAEEHKIQVTNNSENEVTIAYTSPEDFVVTAPDSLTIAAGESIEFSIVPALGVEEGDYQEAIVFYPADSDMTDEAAVITELILHINAAEEEVIEEETEPAEEEVIEEETEPAEEEIIEEETEPAEEEVIEEETEPAEEEIIEEETEPAEEEIIEEETEPETEEEVIEEETEPEDEAESEDDAEPVYENGELELDQEEVVFVDLTEGYTEISDPHDITITNKGDSEITLNYDEPAYFDLTTADSLTIPAGEMVTFTVQPKLDLEASDDSYEELISFWAEGAEDASVSFTAAVNVIALDEPEDDEPETDPSIEVTPASIDFGTSEENYKVPNANKVTVKNTGDADIDIREITSEYYTISEPSAYTIEKGKSITFTIQPNAGLSAGKYPENIYIYEDGSDTDARALGKVSVMFEVTSEEEASPEIVVYPSGLAFGKETVGYTSSPTAQIVTVENTGNVTITLVQPVSSKYYIGRLSRTILTPGSKASFAVKPKRGLPVGSHDEIITIAGSENVAASVLASFTVASQDVILQSVRKPSNVTNVPNGVSKTVSGLRLPSTVTIVTNTGTMSASVAWNVSGCAYDPSYQKNQNFTVYGTVTLPRGVTNPNNVSLNTSVNVSVNGRSGYSASASRNWIEGINSYAVYTTADKISFTAHGDGMSNSSPIQGDTRYLPVKWRVMKNDQQWSSAPYSATFRIQNAGNYALIVTFAKQQYDGSSWKSIGYTDVKQVNFTVRAAGQGKSVRAAVKTGDNTTILPYIIILAVAAVLIIVALIVVLKRRRNK